MAATPGAAGGDVTGSSTISSPSSSNLGVTLLADSDPSCLTLGNLGVTKAAGLRQSSSPESRVRSITPSGGGRFFWFDDMVLTCTFVSGQGEGAGLNLEHFGAEGGEEK